MDGDFDLFNEQAQATFEGKLIQVLGIEEDQFNVIVYMEASIIAIYDV